MSALWIGNVKVWVITADSTRARIFHARGDGALHEAEDLVRPESRTHGRDLASDRSGQQPNVRGATAQSHTVGHEEDPKHEEADRFARSVAATLNTACQDGTCDRLHVIAAPAFLGMLRKHLNAVSRRALVSEVAANVVAHDVSDIRSHLPERL